MYRWQDWTNVTNSVEPGQQRCSSESVVWREKTWVISGLSSVTWSWRRWWRFLNVSYKRLSFSFPWVQAVNEEDLNIFTAQTVIIGGWWGTQQQRGAFNRSRKLLTARSRAELLTRVHNTAPWRLRRAPLPLSSRSSLAGCWRNVWGGLLRETQVLGQRPQTASPYRYGNITHQH